MHSNNTRGAPDSFCDCNTPRPTNEPNTPPVQCYSTLNYNSRGGSTQDNNAEQKHCITSISSAKGVLSMRNKKVDHQESTEGEVKRGSNRKKTPVGRCN